MLYAPLWVEMESGMNRPKWTGVNYAVNRAMLLDVDYIQALLPFLKTFIAMMDPNI